ncbi:hypothetical protein CPB84DRAFT_1751478 [Gymnopilus junonius]|uniref:F-box domain-containing protein n=1 Tax=Gymnopilus junonius TaxID=109634 RepID=A0A9P5NBH6_GYMJU|nr:hypothetical protein CPB84DRAFT_1751478 [Gymnopilus junonius]
MQPEGVTTPTASFDSLPFEIISKIFLDGTQNWRDFEPQVLPFPTIVSGVCTHWRNVSYGIPQLWTFILPPLHKELDECLEWTTKWLERSGTMLVSVVLDDMTVTAELKGPIASAAERKISKTLALLSKHPRRLRRLDIRSASHGAFKKFMRDLWEAPNLEQLSLCPRTYVGLGYFFSPNEEHLKWSVLSRLSNLKKFRFQNISPPCIPSLTSLTAHDIVLKYEGIKTLFAGCPSLAHLVLHDLRPITARQEPAHYTPLSCPSLRSIAVKVNQWYLDEPDYFYVFSFLHLPNLVSLEIQNDLPNIDNFFGSSLVPATIKKLRLSSMIQFGDSLTFFRSLSNLEELEMFEVPAWKLYPLDQDLSDDALVLSSTTMWPHLRSITLKTYDLKTMLSTFEFIEKRSGPSHLHLHLSRSAMWLLAEGDEASDDHDRFLEKFGNDGGKKWLEKLVQVRLMKYPSYGLLDGERVPMAEML